MANVTEDAAQRFDARIAPILTAVDIVDDLVGLPQDAFAAAFERLRVASGNDAESLALELLILLNRYQSALGEKKAALLTAQLCVLIATLLRSTERVRALFSERGISAEDALRCAEQFLDRGSDKTPPSSDRASPTNVFSTLIRSLRER